MRRLILIAALTLAACSQRPQLDESLIANAESTYADARFAASLNGVSVDQMGPIDAKADASVEEMRRAYDKGDAPGYAEASLKSTKATLAVLSLVKPK